MIECWEGRFYLVFRKCFMGTPLPYLVLPYVTDRRSPGCFGLTDSKRVKHDDPPSLQYLTCMSLVGRPTPRLGAARHTWVCFGTQGSTRAFSSTPRACSPEPGAYLPVDPRVRGDSGRRLEHSITRSGDCWIKVDTLDVWDV